jgi:ribose transport system permease protein
VERTQEKQASKIKKLNLSALGKQELVTFISLILLMIFFSVTSEYFLSVSNFLTIGLQTSIIGIIALGMTFVIITSGIDLSVGSTVAFSGIVIGFALKSGIPIPLAILLGLVAGTTVGLINGLLIVKGNLPPFIATLGMMMSLRGLTLALTNGIAISGFDYSFSKFASGKFLGIPNPLIYFLLLGVIIAIILKYMRVGKHTYALGSNEEAAKLSGVNTNKIKYFAYGLTGFLCAFSGAILTSRLISAQPTEGMGYEMDVIAAVIIGGSSLSGGVGTILGTIIGAFIMSVLKNGLNMLDVSGFWQQVIIGIVVLGAVWLDKRKSK